jgi:hypothetical protein
MNNPVVQIQNGLTSVMFARGFSYMLHDLKHIIKPMPRKNKEVHSVQQIQKDDTPAICVERLFRTNHI